MLLFLNVLFEAQQSVKESKEESRPINQKNRAHPHDHGRAKDTAMQRERVHSLHGAIDTSRLSAHHFNVASHLMLCSFYSMSCYIAGIIFQ